MNVKEQLLRRRTNNKEILDKGEEIHEVMNDRIQSMFTKEDVEPPEVDGNPSGQLLA